MSPLNLTQLISTVRPQNLFIPPSAQNGWPLKRFSQTGPAASRDSHLDVPVDEVVELEVVVVLPEGIDERLRYFEPPDEEDELEDEEERRVEVERLKREKPHVARKL